MYQGGAREDTEGGGRSLRDAEGNGIHGTQKQKGVTWEEGDQQEDKGTQSGGGAGAEDIDAAVKMP